MGTLGLFPAWKRGFRKGYWARSHQSQKSDPPHYFEWHLLE
jgi:hypothetical protein